MDTRKDILSVLDRCCGSFTFPMLDNGYIYPAATRLSLYRSNIDWAIVIEVFGFSPRAGLPDTTVYTFGSRLHNRDTPEQYLTREAYDNYLRNNPNNESRSVFPIDEGPWQDPDDSEVLADNVTEISLRGQLVPLPSRDEYQGHGINLGDPKAIHVFEACRFLAAEHRIAVLATELERRVSVPPELNEILTLDEWAHPDIVDDSNRPSSSETFQQLVSVLVTGDISAYKPTLTANTHWSNWPEGGTL